MEVVTFPFVQHSESAYGTIECSCLDNQKRVIFLGTSEGVISCFYLHQLSQYDDADDYGDNNNFIDDDDLALTDSDDDNDQQHKKNKKKEQSSSTFGFSSNNNSGSSTFGGSGGIDMVNVFLGRPSQQSKVVASERNNNSKTNYNSTITPSTPLWGKTPIKQIMCNDQIQVLFIHVQNAIEFFRYELSTLSSSSSSSSSGRKLLKLIHIKRIQESQGLTCFTLDECKTNNRLLVCVKKKVNILHYTEQDCLSVGLDEYILPEPIQDERCLALFDRTLIVGFKKEYSLINIGRGSIVDPKSSSTIPSTILELSGGGGDGKSSDSSSRAPLCVSMDDEVLLRTESICVFVNMINKSSSEQRGMPSIRPPITWSSPPQQISFSFPYVVGVMDQGRKIEIYSIYDARLVKTLYIQPTTNTVTYTLENGSQDTNQLVNVLSWRLLQGSVNLGVMAVCDSFIPTTTAGTSSGIVGFKKEKKEKVQTFVLLCPISYEKQISALFEMAHCSEAFELFERMIEFKREKGEHIDPVIEKRWRQQLLQEAGFASLFHLDIEKAFTYFREHEQALEDRIGFDIRELIVLFPEFGTIVHADEDFHPKISWNLKYLNTEEDSRRPKYLHDLFIERILRRRDLTSPTNEVEKEADQLISKCKQYMRPLLEYRRKKIHSMEKHHSKGEGIILDSAYMSQQCKSGIDNTLFKMYLDMGDLGRLNRMLKDHTTNKNKVMEEVSHQPATIKCYCTLDICSSMLMSEVEILSPEAQEFYMAMLYQTHLNYNLLNVAKTFSLLKVICLGSDRSDSMGDIALDEALALLFSLFDRPLLDESINAAFVEKKKEIFWINLEWCLKLDHFKSVKILNHNVNHLSIDPILKYIRQHLDEETQNEVIQLFLEYIIHEHDVVEHQPAAASATVSDKKNHLDIPTQYYTLLALKYIDVISSYEIRHDSEFILDLRTKFMLHIQECRDVITLETVISRLQGTSMFHEMILLYSLSNEHEKSLRILLFDLYSADGAENYCKEQQARYTQELYENLLSNNNQNSESSVQATLEMYDRNYTKVTIHNELFLILLKLCFQELNINKPRTRAYYDFGVYILNKYAKHIDPISAIKLLPNTLSTKKILPFLTCTLRQTTTNNRTTSLMKGMSRIDFFNAQAELVKYQSRKKFVTRKTKCTFCNRAIGEDACIVFYPDLANIFHYSCFNKDVNVDRISKRNFIKSPYYLVQENK